MAQSAFGADGAEVSLRIFNKGLIRQVLLTSRAVEAIFVKFVRIDDEELSARWNGLLATDQRASLRELLQVTVCTEGLFVFHAESDIGEFRGASITCEAFLVEWLAAMFHASFSTYDCF